MVRHIVLWKFHDNANGKSKAENLHIALGMIKMLKQSIPQIKTLETGINDPAAPLANWDLALVSTFNSFDDLNAYQVHPEHLKLVEFMKKVRDLRSAVDFEF